MFKASKKESPVQEILILWLLFNFQYGQLFRIRRVDSRRAPPMYLLENLLGRPILHRYYGPEIVLSPDPDFDKDYFKVEKILDKKQRNRKTYYLVKYQVLQF